MLREAPKPALILGFAGLIPFVGAAAAVWFIEPLLTLYVIDAQIHYAGVIASFLGAVHWGLALAERHAPTEPDLWRRYGWGVTPALAGSVATQLYFEFALAALILILVAVYFYDSAAAAKGELPGWYKSLRKPLTIGAILSLATTFVYLMTSTVTF